MDRPVICTSDWIVLNPTDLVQPVLHGLYPHGQWAVKSGEILNCSPSTQYHITHSLTAITNSNKFNKSISIELIGYVCCFKIRSH